MASPQLASIGRARINGTEAGLHMVARSDSPGTIIGCSAAMQEVRRLIRQVARTNASVLLTGASGTGKELAARAIHGLSFNCHGPFVAINCAALPETLIESELFGCERGAFTGADASRAGCFELAHNGTLFLDEIGEMPYRAQAKLLRVIEDHNVRRLGGKREIAVAVRVIASTNVDLKQALKSGGFREDLFYRLNAFEINLPDLQDRTSDISGLIDALILDLNLKHGHDISGIAPEALAILHSRSWPGNVRELRNVLERAVILAREGVITTGHLAWIPAGKATVIRPHVWVPVGTTIKDAEIALMRLTVAHTPSKAAAAAALGISYKTLQTRLAEYAVFQSAEARESHTIPEHSLAMTS